MNGKVWWTVQEVEQPGLPRGESTFDLCSSKDSILEVLGLVVLKGSHVIEEGTEDKELWVILTSLNGIECWSVHTMYDCLSVYPKRMTEW
ncbi:hypothetical protein CH063_06112, partial [Colletotrichum higginsianum]